eukprot:1739683-Rhodomonas_salina.2
MLASIVTLPVDYYAHARRILPDLVRCPVLTSGMLLPDLGAHGLSLARLGPVHPGSSLRRREPRFAYADTTYMCMAIYATDMPDSARAVAPCMYLPMPPTRDVGY